MSPIRVRAVAEVDGEIHLRGLPIQKGQRAEVIVLTDENPDEALLSMLAHDPGWQWLRDEAEDVYTEDDVR